MSILLWLQMVELCSVHCSYDFGLLRPQHLISQVSNDLYLTEPNHTRSRSGTAENVISGKVYGGTKLQRRWEKQSTG